MSAQLETSGLQFLFSFSEHSEEKATSNKSLRQFKVRAKIKEGEGAKSGE